MVARRLMAVAVGLALLTACGATEKNWNKKSAKAFCKFEKRCNKSDFFYTYPDVDTCTEANLTMLENLDSYYSACLFDKKMANQCLDALGSRCKVAAAEFEERFDPCYKVWDCAQDFNASTDTSLPF